MARNTGNITVTGAAAHIPEIWAKPTIDAVEANVVIAPHVQTKWKKELTVGDILNIGYISNPTAETKTADTDVTFESPGASGVEGSETITVNTHQYVAFVVENITKVQSQADLVAKYSKKAGYALASAVDVNLAALASSFSNFVGTLGIELTYDNLLRASQYLDDANAPTTDRFIILGPAAKHGILKLDEFKSSDYVGPDTAGQAVRDAYIGKILGAPTYNTTLVTTPSAGQHECWFCQKEGVALIMQDTKTHSTFDIRKDGDMLSFTQLYGYTEVLIPPVDSGGATAVDTHNVLLRTVG